MRAGLCVRSKAGCSDETLGPQNGQGIPEVVQALAGHRASMVRGTILLSSKVSGGFDLVRAVKANAILVADRAPPDRGRAQGCRTRAASMPG